MESVVDGDSRCSLLHTYVLFPAGDVVSDPGSYWQP